MPRTQDSDQSPPKILERLIQEAISLAKKAKRNNNSLSGDNYYGEKFARLKADATNTFNDLSGQSAGDLSAMAELIGNVFDPKSTQVKRKANAQDLLFSLRTTWKDSKGKAAIGDLDPIFPMTLLSQAKRGYLMSIGRQMNESFRSGYYDSSAVMMRRLLEVSIIEAFEGCGISHKIKDAAGNYFQLTDMVQQALAEPMWPLSRNTKKFLPQLRDLGHQSAHGRYFTAQESDILKLQPGIRVVVEEFLRHAKLI